MPYFDFFTTDRCQNISPITVDAIYYLLADDTYHIKHPPIPDSIVLVVTLNGQGTFKSEEHSYILNAGDILLFDAASSRFSYFCSSSNWNFWWFEFRCLLPDFFKIQLNTLFNITLKGIHLDLCEESLAHLKVNDCKTASTLLAAFLCLLQDNAKPSIDSNSMALFRQADQYIRRNLSTVTVESTARFLQISTRTLLNIFQKTVGIQTVEYIHNIKTDMARHLLLIEQNTVREIADQLGYTDSFSFSKSFRKRFGMSPTQYRTYHKNHLEPTP